jgi:hypothetical protein
MITRNLTFYNMLIILLLAVIPASTSQTGDLLLSDALTEGISCQGDRESNKFWIEIRAV